MATDKSELARLRADVKRQQRLVRAKMARADKNYRVDWDLRSNQRQTPIVDPKKVDRYTAKQLNSVLAKQNKFLDRKNILRADAKGHILPAKDVAENMALMRKYYSLAHNEWNKFKDIPAYHSEERFGDGQTLEDIRKQRTPDHGLGASSDSLGNVKPSRKYSSVRDADALRKLNEGLRDKVKPGYFDRRHERMMQAIAEQLSLFGGKGEEVYDKIADMTPKARKLLLTDRRFMDSLTANYERIKAGYELGDNDSIEAQVIATEFNDIDRRIRWAEDRSKTKPRRVKRNK